jgi:hypothetical protein
LTGAPEVLVAHTIEFLDGITQACSKGGFLEKGVAVCKRDHWYTRAAAALTTFITRPDARLSTVDLPSMTMRKQTVAYVFNASGFRNMSHLVDLIKEPTDDGKVQINKQRAALLLVFINLDDVPDELLDLALSQPKEFLLFLVLGWLNQRAVITAQGEKNRGRLLASGALLADATITNREIPALINAWMYSSYASRPDKHEIKTWFNHLLINRLKAVGVQPRPVSYELKKRPTILVIHERFASQHAMYRCYAPSLRSVAPYFTSIALAGAGMIDASADDIFDQVIKLPDPMPSVEELVALIQNLEPDIVYYPSLGMSHWTVMLAGLRLAPIQVMTHGHPATSKFDTIDYAYVAEMNGDLSLIHSERIINGPATVVFDQHADLPDKLPAVISPSNREVRVAVNSKVMKLSHRLMEICRRIDREAKVPVKFSFFPGERFVYMDGLEAAIKSQLPSATVASYCDYASFLEQLAQCDLALSAFPFGNTNSTVDTCLLGIPTVAHFGPESPAQSDWMVMRTAGLPDWLVSDNDEDYFQTALRLVNDPAARVDALAGIDREEIRRRLYKSADQPEPFGEVLYKMYCNHPELIKSEARVFDFTDILALPIASP